MLSKVFPATHSRKGEPTYFSQKVQAGQYPTVFPNEVPKLHTIRENYDLWLDRIAQVQAGDAEICLRQWKGAPYRSKTDKIMRLGWQDGVGIQKLNFGWHNGKQIPIIEGWYMYGDWGSKAELAKNDGLSLEDWQEWFRDHEQDIVYDKPLAIIHFTNFRY
jgi:hypothetical protein